MGIDGKHWITPDGVIDVGNGDFNTHARAAVLGLSSDYQIKFIQQPLLPMGEDDYTELQENTGVNQHGLDILFKGADAKTECIRKGWIRHVRGHFDVWKLNDETLRQLQTAKAFWQEQVVVVTDKIEISAVSTEMDVWITFGDFMLAKNVEDVFARRITV